MCINTHMYGKYEKLHLVLLIIIMSNKNCERIIVSNMKSNKLGVTKFTEFSYLLDLKRAKKFLSRATIFHFFFFLFFFQITYL